MTTATAQIESNGRETTTATAQDTWSGWQDFWNTAPNIFGGLCVAPDASGRQVVIALDPHGNPFRTSQTSPNGPWAAWAPMSAGSVPFDFIALARNEDGRLEAFAVGSPSPGAPTQLFHSYQEAPAGNWSAWTALGAPAGHRVVSAVTARDNAGALHVFVGAYADGVGGIWESHQVVNRANGPRWEWSPWAPMTGKNEPFAMGPVVMNQDGRLELFALGNGGAYHRWQTSLGGPWSEWTPLSFGSAKNLLGMAVAQNKWGWLEAFAMDHNGTVWHVDQKHGWQGAAVLGQLSDGHRPLAAGQNHDGLIRLFARGSDRQIWSIEQNTNASWDGASWTPLPAQAPGAVPVSFVVGQNADGRLEVFAHVEAGGAQHLTHAWETTRSGHLAWLTDLVTRVAPIVHLHPTETYKPSAFDKWYVERTSYVDEQGKNRGPLTPQIASEAGFGANGSMTFPWGNGPIMAGDLPGAVCYAHARNSADWTTPGYDIQYWFFYPFNGPGIAKISINDVSLELDLNPIGDHQGDWEHILVRVDAEGKIRRVYCSQHDGGTWYDVSGRPGPNVVQLTPDGHPIVYSALNGHPSFPQPGEYVTQKDGKPLGFSVSEAGITVKAEIVNLVAAGPVWDCHKTGALQLVAVNVPGVSTFAEPWWLNFRGRCGVVSPNLNDVAEIVAQNFYDKVNPKFPLIPGFVIKALGHLFAQAITRIGEKIENFDGPTAPKEKDGWYTGL